MPDSNLSIVWLRRDLRLHDHAALFKALEQPGLVQPVFVFDTEILAQFPSKKDGRLSFIAKALEQIDAQLRKRGGGLIIRFGNPETVIPALVKELGAQAVFAAEDYEPATQARDAAVAKQVKLQLVKDHVVFAPYEVLKDDRTPYKVFTPYSKAWHARFSPACMAEYAINDKGRYRPVSEAPLSAKDMLAKAGYELVDVPFWPVADAKKRLQNFIAHKSAGYPRGRDMVAEDGTSRISPYLRFGLVSARETYRAAYEKGGADKWILELIWREFYAMILYHYPESVTKEWNPNYRGLNWSYDESSLEAWKQGKTGYPMVDAAMRQLLAEGWMHNRARMVVASFLTKDLQLDWRLGEAHFAQYLMDYELASNVGGWQWAASTGTDAQPWFRIFNPILQSKRFDPDGDYIRTYVPELAYIKDDTIHEPWKMGLFGGYIPPMVDHGEAREKTLRMFREVTDEPKE